jgi:ribokinase
MEAAGMTMIAITGYVSLDHVVQIEAPPLPNETAIAARAQSGSPRLGGSPSYVAMALVRAGVRRAIPITWIANDENGARLIAALEAAGVPTEGIARSLHGRTPTCILAYDPTGACHVIDDPAASRAATLTETQRRIVEDSDWVCVTVGPLIATRAALSYVRPKQRLAWVVEADGDAFPADLRTALAARADLVVHSRSERAFVAEALAGPARPGRIVVETRGGEGAMISVAGLSEVVPATHLPTNDPTGAGDTFVGGLLAALIEGPSDTAAAVRKAQTAAHDMLRERIESRSARETG